MKNNNWEKTTRETYNNPRKTFSKSSPSEYHSTKMLSGKTISVRGDDVNGALRKLKKVLERDDRQKDISKHEYYEKPSIKRKRAKDVAKSRWRRDVDTRRSQGTWVDSLQADNSWLKSKRKRRKHVTLVDKIKNRKKG